jgi:nucleoside-diphosphate-sugar epimerase
MKVLVTGDKGYIGSVLVPLLLKNNIEVTGIDTHFFTTGLKPVNKKYKSIKKDVRHIKEKDLEGFDAIIHLAALSNDPLGEINPGLTEEINLKASKNLAKLAKQAGVKRFLFSSSCSIYGIAKDGIVNESSPVSPQTAYAESKIKMEEFLKELADKNFCVGLLRNSTVYGYSPKFRNDLVVNNFVTCAIALGKIRIMSDGTPWRPLIDVRDLSKIFIEFLSADEKKINGKTINIGFNENNFQVKDLVAAVHKFLPECEIEFTGEHGSDTRSYQVNFDTFSKLFPQFKQEWKLEKSVKHLIEKLKKQNYTKEDFLSGKFTRLAVIKSLLEKKIVDNNLFFITQ